MLGEVLRSGKAEGQEKTEQRKSERREERAELTPRCGKPKMRTGSTETNRG
jgi:hypothetical protein